MPKLKSNLKFTQEEIKRHIELAKEEIAEWQAFKKELEQLLNKK